MTAPSPAGTAPLSPAANRRGPSVTQALLIAAAVMAVYVVFNYYRVGDLLYDFSKTLASYDYRQYLGMSKRWMMQYGHAVFLFVFLILTRFIFVWDKVPAKLSRAIAIAIPFTVPIFIIHFPLLYFFAAITDHDPRSTFDQVRLLVLVLSASIAFGILCNRAKPYFDALQKWVMARLAPRNPERVIQVDPSKALKITKSHSEFLKVVRTVATLSIAYGHYNFAQFSSFEVPGFDHWRRWAVPFFFMISGYFTMLSLDRARGGTLQILFRRYAGIWYAALPMLLIIAVLDRIGFQADPLLYYLHEKFVTPLEGGPADLRGFLFTLVNSLLFLNEIWIYKLLGWGTELGGVRAFSNDSYWFLCYLLPFTALLVVARRCAGPMKYVWLMVLCAFFGPAILMLSPLFFSGALAYQIHKRY